MKVLFLVPYPYGESPSQRFRFEQYLPTLNKKGVTYEVLPFFDKAGWEILYKSGHYMKKLLAYIKGTWNRIRCLFRLGEFDYVFIHREATPIGPAWVEWFIAKVAKKDIIFDFDDAIWMPDGSKVTPLFRMLKNYSKVAHICKWSHTLSCGNQYLASYGRRYNKRVSINPSTVDTENLHVPQPVHNQHPVVGWTGSHSTMQYLNSIIPLLKKVHEDHPFTLKVICNTPPEFDFPNLIFVRWSKENEIDVLNSIDIGIMPLFDTPWAQGKCGFKLLQYMALNKPTIASAIGANNDIIDHGLNGFLCRSQEDWGVYLSQLLGDNHLRDQLGENGRNKVIEKYSVRSNQENFLSLFPS